MTTKPFRTWFTGAAAGAVLASAAAAQWNPVDPVPDARSRPAGAIIGDTFYFMGGEASGGVRPVTAFKLDIPNGSWSSIADLPSNGVGLGGVSNVDAAAIGTDIYIAGGWTGAAAVNILLKYDSTNDTWTTVATDPVPTTLFANSLEAAGGKLYATAGAVVSGVLNTQTYIYDPNAPAGTRWSTGPGMAVGRQYPGSTVIGGKVYVGGGIGTSVADQKNTVEVFDPVANSWMTLPVMSKGRGGMALYNLNGEPYAVAGGWSQYYTDTEVFNGASWSAGDPVNFGARTIAHDGNASWLVKAGGWNGAFQAFAEVFQVESACYPDCDENGQLNIDDFICFQLEFALQTPYADCDGNQVHNIDDFICFQLAFALGC